MPELPEVETIVRALQEGGRDEPSIACKRIQTAQVYWEKTVANLPEAEFRKKIRGSQIVSIFRKGKFVVFQLDKGFLLFHLRMSGDLRVEEIAPQKREKAPLKSHDRLVLNFDDGWRLTFNDARKFGRVWLTDRLENVTGKLGIDPFDSSLDQGRLHKMLLVKKRQLKPLLLDQTFLAGIGNIYSDEALNLAKLHPLRRANTLSREEADALLKSLRAVLKKGIKLNGASIDWVYRGGGFQNHFKVYQRTGEPCPECGTLIQRITVGQRGTHFCPNCQQLADSELSLSKD